ncbi:MAG: hypothetical protein ACRDTM_12295, partial [Micromonosporaceae bacterium]
PEPTPAGWRGPETGESPRTDASPRPDASARRRPQPVPSKAAASDDDDLLPRRVRQASLATELRETTPGPPEPVVRERPPEQIRSMMTAFQRGSLRGRSDAERLNDDTNGSDQQPRDDGAS